VCGRGDEALGIVKRRKFDIVLIDLYMSQVPGIELLNACIGTHRDTIAIVMTGNPSVSSSVETLEAGAWDYLPKPFSATHLQLLIGRASHAVMVNREASDLRLQVLQQSTQGEGGGTPLIGISPLFRKAVEL